MPYWSLYYHVVWATRNREPWITSEIEPVLYGFVGEKTRRLGGRLFALNGVEDHVHLVTAIPPKIAIAQFVGQVKGFSSSRLNQTGRLGARFAWQSEYSVFSLDRKRLPHHVHYVERQKEHHAQASVIQALEPGDLPREVAPPASAGAPP